MAIRTRDWFRQAVKDLKHSRRSLKGGDYEWSCFAAQQAAEKAVKALYQSIHVDAIGHSVARLLKDLPKGLKPSPTLLEKAKLLDKHYIPTRYPNFHPEGAPMDYYVKAEAEEAVKNAEEVIEYCKSKIPIDKLR